MKTFFQTSFFIIIVFFIMLLSGVFYTVKETDQVIITRFKNIVGKPITTPGFKLKFPFIDKVNRLPKNVLSWDGDSIEIPTKDKLYIKVDTFARWQIIDPIKFFQRFTNERRAYSRLDVLLGGETRSIVAKHDLIEFIRTTKNRVPEISSSVQSKKYGYETQVSFDPIKIGRSKLEKDILDQARPNLVDLGINLLDIRFKRINYNSEVEDKIFNRMISERKQISERFRSEGEGEASKILGNMEKEVKRIESEAYEKVQTILGKSEALAAKIYAEAYDMDNKSAELYQFIKTMESYKKMLSSDTTLVLSSDSDLFKMLKSEKSLKSN